METKFAESFSEQKQKKRILISTRRQICNTFQLLGHFSYKEKGYTMPVYSRDTIKWNAIFIYHTLCSVVRLSSKCAASLHDESYELHFIVSTMHICKFRRREKKIVEPSLKRNSYIHTE